MTDFALEYILCVCERDRAVAVMFESPGQTGVGVAITNLIILGGRSPKRLRTTVIGQQRSFYCLFSFRIKVNTVIELEVHVRDVLLRVKILQSEFRKSSQWGIRVRVTCVFD